METHKIFFTSDTHFYHSNIIKYCDRPFGNKHDMNEELISQWNTIVGDNDEVYRLGDFSLGSPKVTEEVLDRLKGRIHLIKGNHEKSVLRNKSTRDRFESIQDVLKLKVEDDDCSSGYQDIFMSHYAHRVWDKSHHGCWHLYGHSHNGLEDIEWGKSMDVGVDSYYHLFGKYTLFTYNDIKNILLKR